MSVAGPSRAPPSGRRPSAGRVESTYEDDLLGLLDQLGPDELGELQTFYTHRTRDGQPLSDHDVAMSDLLQQARALAVFNQDRELAQRIAAGEDVGGDVDRRPAQTPNAVALPNGSRTAAQQNGHAQLGAQAAARNDAVPSQTWGGWLSSMVGWAFSLPPPLLPLANAGTSAPKALVSNLPTGHDCVICQDPIRGAEVRAPCGHYYGIDCITDLFRSATKDESLYPPRCCRQNIPFAQVRPHLPQTLVATFAERQVELGTLNRVYCSSPVCSRFLGPLSGGGIFATKVYTCPAPGCGRRTCGGCREPHGGDRTHVCRPDASATEVLALGNAAGWARCPGCSQLIELHIGCFHMTCRCQTEFCYLCRARWKTCRCPQWEERRLMAVAEERVDAQLGVARERGVRPAVLPRRPAPPPAPAAPRQPRVLDANARTVVPGARPPAPAPVPAPAPAPAPAPVRLPTVQFTRPPPPTAPAPTPPSSTGRTAAGQARRPPPRHPDLRPVHAVAPTPASASTSTSAPTPRAPAPYPGKSTGTEIDSLRQQMVREMMERLRVDRDCRHGQWQYRQGGGTCQTCGHQMPRYLFRCQDCETLVCNGCRRNRL